MTSPLRYRAADTDRLAELRSDGWPPGARLLRRIVRSGDDETLGRLAVHAFDRLVDEVARVARDDDDGDVCRGKAAEFLVRLRARPATTADEILDLVGEAAAASRYRSARVLDHLAVWLFVHGERHLAALSDTDVRAELEAAHPELWTRFRSNLLEVLEAGRERLRGGRRFRIGEIYLARFRLLRARSHERGGEASKEAEPFPARRSSDDAAAEYVEQMVVDLFALSLDRTRQRLVVSQIPSPTALRRHRHVHGDARLFQRLRAVHPDQARTRWTRVAQALDLPPRQAVSELNTALATHLRRCWAWFFPGRHPFGAARAALDELDEARLDLPAWNGDEEQVARMFDGYRRALRFLVELALQDLESRPFDLEREGAEGGSLP